jgi:hypothetical protein
MEMNEIQQVYVYKIRIKFKYYVLSTLGEYWNQKINKEDCRSEGLRHVSQGISTQYLNK